jgi:hypothetical protein
LHQGSLKQNPATKLPIHFFKAYSSSMDLKGIAARITRLGKLSEDLTKERKRWQPVALLFKRKALLN